MAQVLSNRCSKLNDLEFNWILLEDDSTPNYITFRCEEVTTGNNHLFRFYIPDEQTGLYELAKGRFHILPLIQGLATKEGGFPTDVVVGKQTYMNMISTLWNKFASRLHFQGKWEPSIVIRGIEAFFTNSEVVRSIPDYARPGLKNSISKLIMLQDTTYEYETRIPYGFAKYVDPNTTPTTERVGEIYMLANDARIEGEKLVQGDHVLSTMNLANTIYPRLAPSQFYKNRSVFKTGLELVNGNHPHLRSMMYQNELSGVELRTAIMEHPLNHHDAIVISESTANKLRAYHVRPFNVVSTTKPDIYVQAGDIYNPAEDILTVQPDIHDQDTKRGFKPSFYRVNDMVMVEEVRVLKTLSMGEPVYKTKIYLRSTEPCLDGDKIITRHGGKGVVRIIEDSEMPTDTEGNSIEVIVHPLSVGARNNQSILAEMSMYNLMEKEGIEDYLVDPDEIPNWASLMEEGHAKETYLTDSLGNMYDVPTMVGKVFWIRTDSIARNRMSSTNKDLTFKKDQKRPDNTSAGTRFDFTTRQILVNMGLGDLDAMFQQKHQDIYANRAYRDNIMMLTASVEEVSPL